MNPNDPPGKEAEVLSQSEVERLLSQVQAEEVATTVVKSAGVKSRYKWEDVQPCDFRQREPVPQRLRSRLRPAPG